MARTHYRVLGVKADADTKQLKAAFREVVKANHPDLADAKGWDAAEKARREKAFKRAAEAFAVLSREDSRAEYDRELRTIRNLYKRQKAAEARYAAAKAENERLKRQAAARRNAPRKQPTGRPDPRRPPVQERPQYKPTPAHEFHLHVEDLARQVQGTAERRLLRERAEPIAHADRVDRRTNQILGEILIGKLDDLLASLG